MARGPLSVNDSLEAVRPRTPLPSAFSIYETVAGSPQSPRLPHFCQNLRRLGDHMVPWPVAS